MNSEYKDCQYFFKGKCRCMDYSFNQDFYECPQCRDVPYCYYRQLKKCEQKLEKIKELCQIPNEPYYNSECEFGKGRIDLGQEILEIIRGE